MGIKAPLKIVVWPIVEYGSLNQMKKLDLSGLFGIETILLNFWVVPIPVRGYGNSFTWMDLLVDFANALKMSI